MGTVTRQWEVREMSEGGKSILFKKTIVKNGDRWERGIYFTLGFFFFLGIGKKIWGLAESDTEPLSQFSF